MSNSKRCGTILYYSAVSRRTLYADVTELADALALGGVTRQVFYLDWIGFF